MLCEDVNGQEQLDAVKDRDGNVYAVRILADNKQWLARNLNIQVDGSYCYNDSLFHCKTYGRLYTLQAAIEGCRLLGEGWHLPGNDEFEFMAAQYGGVRNDSTNNSGKEAYKALSMGGYAQFDIIFGGNREQDGKGYGRRQAHGFYWTSTKTTDSLAWFYNFGPRLQIVNRHPDGEILLALSVRCVRDVIKKQ